MEHVAVTGAGVVTPIGSTIESFWKNLLDGKRAIAPMPERSRVSGNALWAAVPDDFLEHASLPPNVIRNTDRFTQYAMVATGEALRHANLDPPAERTAVIIGNTMGGFPQVADAQSRFIEGGSRAVTPKLMALVIPNMASALIAMHWKLHGPQLAISTACASSLDAIGLASGMIERGEIDAAIAGGSETLLSPLVYESLVRAGALSRNADVARASRPFDAERDGFVMGDGAADRSRMRITSPRPIPRRRTKYVRCAMRSSVPATPERNAESSTRTQPVRSSAMRRNRGRSIKCMPTHARWSRRSKVTSATVWPVPARCRPLPASWGCTKD
jgi:3-oxoacyl-(acyl-carrier-protein) synthase